MATNKKIKKTDTDSDRYTPEQTKKIFFILFLFAVVIIAIVVSQTSPSNNYKSGQPNIVRDLNDQYLGETYNLDLGDVMYEKYGSPVTLKGTNHIVWVAYFPKGNFTMTQTKVDHKIIKFQNGRKPR